MLRICRQVKPASIVHKRFAHGVHYGPEEPLKPYLKWVAVVGVFGGLVVFDRFYSNQSISNLLTPTTDTERIEKHRQRFADRQVQEQDRNIELLYPRKRSSIEVFNPRPVPESAHRALYSNAVFDTDNLSERRERSTPHKSE